MTSILRLGSRGSALALWQTEHVAAALQAAHPGLRTEIVIIKTQGDKILDVPLARIGDRGLFVKEIEEALLDGRVDAAVHSLKDLPTVQPDGLVIAAVGERADARDVLVSPRFGSLAELPDGAVVGTSSLRRKAQLKAAHPGLHFKDVRGNLQTRLGKLDAGEYDALVLAAAGLDRLGLGDRVRERLAPEASLPAVGQGALAIECRAADDATRGLLASLEHAETRACVTAERALLRALEGGCQVPIAAHARLVAGELVVHGLVAAIDGDPVLRAERRGAPADADAIGRALAEDLRGMGADAVLAAIRDVSLP